MLLFSIVAAPLKVHFLIKFFMSTIRINNKTFQGNNIVVSNNKVYIDGKLQEQDGDERNISIVVEGNLDKLDVDVCDKIDINGNVGTVKTTSGYVACGNVQGAINTVSGDIMCDDVGGNINTVSGDIKCKSRNNQ